MEYYRDENHTQRNLKRKDKEFNRLYISTELDETFITIQYDDEIEDYEDVMLEN